MLEESMKAKDAHSSESEVEEDEEGERNEETDGFLNDQEGSDQNGSNPAEPVAEQQRVHVCPPCLSFVLYAAYFLGSSSAIIAVLATEKEKKV